MFDGEEMPFPQHRSLTAVALATCLEQSGLRWRVIDPGVSDLGFWRGALATAQQDAPKVLAISTTFITSAAWLKVLCLIARRLLPQTKFVLGGYYYATNTKAFLNSDADVLCVGEGEARLPLIVQRIRDGSALIDIPGSMFVGATDRFTTLVMSNR